MKKNYWDTLLIWLTIFVAGACLIIWALPDYLDWAAKKVLAGNKQVLVLMVGGGYVIGWFVTRMVEGSFHIIFSMAPFSEILFKEKDAKTFKHPRWVDSVFIVPIAYSLFFGLAVVGVFAVGALLRLLGAWLHS